LKYKEELFPKNSRKYLRPLYTLGYTYLQHKKYKKAENVANSARLIYINNNAKNNVGYIQVSTLLAVAYKKQFAYGKAIDIYEEIALILKKRGNGMSSHYGNLLANLADLYREQGLYQKAKKVMLESLKIVESSFGKKDSNYANACRVLADILKHTNDKAEAEALYKEAIKITEENVGSKHYLYAQRLNSLALLYHQKNEYQKAESLYKQAIKIHEETLNKKHTDYFVIIQNLGDLYKDQTLYSKAKYLYQKSITLTKTTFGENHIRYTNALEKIAILEYLQTNYTHTEQYYLRIRNIRQKLFGALHPSYLIACNNLAMLYMSQGLFAKSKKLFIENKKVYEKKLGVNNANYANVLIQLAYLYTIEKKFKEAEAMLLKSKDIIENNMGRENLIYAQLCDKLGNLYKNKGMLDNAKQFLKQSISIKGKILGVNSLEYIHSQNLLTQTYFAQGLYKEAEPLLLAVHKKYEEYLGKQHMLYIGTTFHLGFLYKNIQLLEKAKPFFLQSAQSITSLMKQNNLSLSEKNKTKNLELNTFFIRRFYEFTLLYLKKHPQNTQILEDVFNLQLTQKAQFLSAKRRLQTSIARMNDAQLQQKYEQYSELKNQIASSINLPLKVQKQRGINLDVMIQKAEQLEKELSYAVGADSSDYSKISFKDIKQTLAKDEAAIEIVRFQKYHEDTKKNHTTYISLIVTNKDQYPNLVMLSEDAKLEQKHLKAYQKAIQSKTDAPKAYQFFWQPIAQKLKAKGITKVYVSLDGVYHQINLNTLQNLQTGKYVEQEVDLRVVSNLRDIIKYKKKKPRRQRRLEAKANVQLFGRPAYDLSIASLLHAEKTLGNNAVQDNANPISKTLYKKGKKGLRSGWSDLPATEIEVNKIAQIIKKNSQLKVITHLKEQALEKAVKQVQSPKILHIATHGFFVERFKAPTKVQKEEVVFDNFSRGNTNQLSFYRQRDSITSLEPMLRSGVVFAGVSSYEKAKDKPKTEDGILTAYEASVLDLKNTDVVVLSACETGLGQITNGEGVYGLQRAFMVAGARSVLMSLWKVDDQATQILMTQFYEEWIHNKKSKREAFRAAQDYLRNYTNQAGKQLYKAPYYWGAFSMIGE
jgi:CHAT domain-containing protein